MPILTPLDPVPRVLCGPVEIVALDAARTERGLLATVQATNGRVLVVRHLYLIEGEDARRFASEVATFGYTDVETMVASLRELVPGVELSLRGAPTDESGAPWETPVPLQEFRVPAFPVAVLPDWLAGMAEDIAGALQVPMDLPGMLSLAVLAVACAGKIVVQPRLGWHEPTNLYIVVALLPGARKTPAFEALTAPLVAWEEAAAERSVGDIADAASRKSILEKSLTKAQGVAAGSKAADRALAMDEAAQLARDLAEYVVPVAPQLVADDVTPEKLALLLCDHGGRMALMSPEGDVFDLMAGRYSQGAPNLGVFLKGHAGDTLRVDRIGRPSAYVRHPALTLGLAVQPDVLRGLAARPSFRGRGLLGRFLYALPPSLLGRRNVDAEVMHPAIRDIYGRHMAALLEMPFGAGAAGEQAPHVLTMDTDAQALLREYERWIEPQLLPDGDLGSMTDWGGKLAGAVVRLAGVLHCAEWAPSAVPWRIPISAETLTGAITLGSYLIPHARAAFAEMGSDSVGDSARHIVGWLERKRVDAFRKAHVFRDLHRRFTRKEDLDSALSLLVDHGYIRELLAAKKGVGRKPSATFLVNPRWMDGLGERVRDEGEE